MILFTALGGTVKYLAVGRLPWRFLLWFGSIGVLGGQTGQRLVKKLIQRTGRPSIVVFLLGTIIALAVIIMATMGIVNGVKARDAEIGRDRQHEPHCSPLIRRSLASARLSNATGRERREEHLDRRGHVAVRLRRRRRLGTATDHPTTWTRLSACLAAACRHPNVGRRLADGRLLRACLSEPVHPSSTVRVQFHDELLKRTRRRRRRL